MQGAFVHNILTFSSLSQGSLLVGYNYFPWHVTVVEEPYVVMGMVECFYFDLEGGYIARVIPSGCPQ